LPCAKCDDININYPDHGSKDVTRQRNQGRRPKAILRSLRSGQTFYDLVFQSGFLFT